MHKSASPSPLHRRRADPTVLLFRVCMGMVIPTVFALVLTYRDTGIWSLFQGWIISATLIYLGFALRHAVRAREITEPTAIRMWMRPAIGFLFLLAITMGAFTLWQASL